MRNEGKTKYTLLITRMYLNEECEVNAFEMQIQEATIGKL